MASRTRNKKQQQQQQQQQNSSENVSLLNSNVFSLLPSQGGGGGGNVLPTLTQASDTDTGINGDSGGSEVEDQTQNESKSTIVLVEEKPLVPDGRLIPSYEHVYGALGVSLDVEIYKTVFRVFLYVAAASNVLLEKIFSNTTKVWLGMTSAIFLADLFQLILTTGIPACRSKLKKRPYQFEVYKLLVLHLSFQTLAMIIVVATFYHLEYDFTGIRSGDVMLHRLDDLNVGPLLVSTYVNMTFQNILLYGQFIWIIGICGAMWLFVRETKL